MIVMHLFTVVWRNLIRHLWFSLLLKNEVQHECTHHKIFIPLKIRLKICLFSKSKHFKYFLTAIWCPIFAWLHLYSHPHTNIIIFSVIYKDYCIGTKLIVTKYCWLHVYIILSLSLSPYNIERELADCSQGQPKSSLFNSYYTEV